MIKCIIRKYQINDSISVSNLIRNTLNKVNSKDYSQEIIDKMCRHFTPEKINENSISREIYVAVQNEKIIGTVSINNNNIHSFFVDYKHLNEGIGTALYNYIETRITDNGFKEIIVPSSITSEYFYHKNGFTAIEAVESIFGKNIIMKKMLK